MPPAFFFNLLRSARALAVSASLFVSGGAHGGEVVVYETDFEDFTVGEDTLSGTDEWLATNPGEGVHGIDEDAIEGVGLSAYIGFNQPSSDFVTVFRDFDNPVTASNSKIDFYAAIGIADSTIGFFDIFYLTFYNDDDFLLGAIAFDNSVEDFGLWRDDGTILTHTGVGFTNDVVHEIFVTIDFSENTWTAQLNDTPVFTDAPFNANGADLDLGSVAAEWELNATGTAGDNWMLFDDWKISYESNDTPEPFSVSSIVHNDDRVTLTWPSQDGMRFRVQYSTDLVTWKSDLPLSNILPAAGVSTVVFRDSSPDSSNRYYRVVKTPSGAD